MEHDPNKPSNSKQEECPLTNQINRYRNSLPQVPRSEDHFFFKQVTQEIQQIAYVTIGFRVGQIPFQLMDLFAVIINEIHCYTDANLKVIIDGDRLWVTSITGFRVSELDGLRNNIEEANTSEALQKTRNLLQELLTSCDNDRFQNDKVVLEKVRKEIAKSISQIFKNPNIDD